MTSWLILAVAGQFLTAISVLVDKHIVVRKAEHIGRPIVYAFYISLFSGFVLVLVPFGLVSLPGTGMFGLSLIEALLFLGGIYFLYHALKEGRAADVAPVVGAVSALTTLVLAPLLIKGDVSTAAVPSIGLLIVGTALISHFHFKKEVIRAVFLSGIFFGSAIVLAKIVYVALGFLDGFFWTRFMSMACALLLLVHPALRKIILHSSRTASNASKALVVGNKTLAGVASLITALAVSWGSVSVVNALSGLQFVFLFGIAFVLSHASRRFKHMSVTHGGWQSAVGIMCIVGGLALLALEHLTL